MCDSQSIIASNVSFQKDEQMNVFIEKHTKNVQKIKLECGISDFQFARFVNDDLAEKSVETKTNSIKDFFEELMFEQVSISSMLVRHLCFGLINPDDKIKLEKEKESRELIKKILEMITIKQEIIRYNGGRKNLMKSMKKTGTKYYHRDIDLFPFKHSPKSSPVLSYVSTPESSNDDLSCVFTPESSDDFLSVLTPEQFE